MHENATTFSRLARRFSIEVSWKPDAVQLRHPGTGNDSRPVTALCLSLRGIIQRREAEHLQRFFDLVATLPGQKIILDFSNVPGISQSGFDVLFNFVTSIEKMGLELEIRQPGLSALS